MAKAQHAPIYRVVPQLLREMREAAGLTQRQLGKALARPQSWIYNCESANRRVDITELLLWCRACGADPHVLVERLLAQLGIARHGGSASSPPAKRGGRRR